MIEAHSNHSVQQSDIPHVVVRGYLIGFVLAVVLTAGSFWSVMSGALEGQSAIVTLAALAAVQMIVHVVFFLHVNTSKRQRWHVGSFAYTITMSLVIVVGTAWVIRNVHMLMMAR